MGSALSPGQRWLFAAILLVAAGLRLWAALATGPVHPDEIFQYLEQAHRAAFGFGITTWEHRYGMRSGLLPLLLAGPMALGAWIAPDGGLHLLLPRLVAVLFGVAGVWGAFRIGDALSRFHAFFAMAVAAVWFDLVYFGGHVLTEPAATSLILLAVGTLVAPAPNRRALVVAGVLLGLAGILRFHYLPAIGLLVLLSCGLDWRERWLPLILGGLAAAAIGAAVDLFMGQLPFAWIVANFTQNIVADRAAGFGEHPPGAYLDTLIVLWGPGLVALILLLIPVLRPYRALILAAALNLLLHSLVGHKEYRFIFLSVAILVVVAAIGSAELLRRLQARRPAWNRPAAGAALLALWLGASAALAGSGRLQSDWRAFLAGSEAATALRAQPGVCGVGMVGLNLWDTGGYSYLRRNVPLYVAEPPFDIGSEQPLPQLTPAFNAVLAPEHKLAALPSAYRRVACSEPHLGVDPARRGTPVRICVLVRDGGCTSEAGTAHEVQAVMKRQDW